jgi:Anti-sigma factor NepR
MANTTSGGSGEKPAPRRNGADEEGAEAFDIWLQRGLHQLYDSVAKEPIPDDLLRLIEQDRADRSK